jgi:PASTA domain
MPGEIKIGGQHFKKSTVYMASAGVAGIGVIVYMRKRSATNAATTSTNAATAGTIDPATGLTAGSPQDNAALAAQNGSGYGIGGSYGSSVSGNGSIIGYDNQGNPVYGNGGTSGTPPGPGNYTSNAQWAQAFEQQVGSTGTDAVAAALGKYLTGQPMTPDQVTTMQEAVAAQGYPPVSGLAGDPPSYKTVSTPANPPTTTTKVVVPNVMGKSIDAAEQALNKAGLVAHLNSPVKRGTTYVVNSQTPGANLKVDKGSTVNFSVTVKKK